MSFHFSRSGGFRLSESKPRTDGEHWWRAEDRRYADWDPWADEQPNSSHLQIELRCYPVVRHTRKGVWLDTGFGGEVFVLGTARKQFAVPTQELAVADLIARKKMHVAGCAGRLQMAELHLAAAEATLNVLADRK